MATWSSPPHPDHLTCPTSGNRHITVMSGDADVLKDRIDDMWAAGNTSIDIGVKWGLALLDPSTRPIITDMIASGKVPESFAGRPVDHDETQVLKALVVMSDGENTSQFMLDDDYRSGDSPLFRDKNNGRESYFFDRSNTNNDYYYYRNDQWRSTPYRNWDRAERLSWPEVWASRSLANFAYYSKSAAIGGNWYAYYLDAYDAVSPSTKNTRTSQICHQAKDAGITVYTIGMETYGQGDITLADCASGSAFFFDVQAVEISEAFSAIARDINRLRLTQ